MTAAAVATRYGGVGRFLIGSGNDLLMAGVAEVRLFFPEKDSAQQAMGEVALFAVLCLDRGVAIALEETIAHLWMAIQALFCRWLTVLSPLLNTG